MATTHPSPAVSAVPLVLKHILVLTDFSEHSHMALKQAAAIARLHSSDLTLMHVIPPEPVIYSALEPATWDREATIKRAEADMRKAADDECVSGIKHESVIETGDFEQALLSTIKDHEISMVVTGTHGRSGIRKLIIGSIAEIVFRVAPCPVLTIGPDVPPNLLSHGRFQSVLFATDFSEGSRHALPYAVGFAQESRARLTLMHVIEEGSVSAAYLHDQLMSNARHRLDELLPVTAHLESPVDVEVVSGYPVEAILRTARKIDADLVVLGVHKSHGLGARTSAHLPWTIAQSVVGHAKCPVLSVRG